MTVDGRDWLKPCAIVAHLHHQAPTFPANGDFDVCAFRVADDVVGTFLENQEHLTPNIRSDAELVFAARSPELKFNAAR
jgi:hypothetical protein